MLITKTLSTAISVLGLFWQEKINAQIFRWHIFLVVIQLVYLLLVFGDIPPQVPLYYSNPWGESQLTSPNHLFLFPIFSVIIWLVNYLFSAVYLNRNQLLSKLLIIFSLVFSLLSTVALFRIVNLTT